MGKYICGDIDKYQDVSLLILEWKETWPEEPGLYWAETHSGMMGFHLKQSSLSSHELYFADWYLDELVEQYAITRWLGPLPEPERDV